MKTVREFNYKDVNCSIVYYSELRNYTLISYIEGKIDKVATIFPSNKKTDVQNSIAFHVANLHILPTWY